MDHQLTDPNFILVVANYLIGSTGMWFNMTYNFGSYFLSAIRLNYLTVDGAFTQPFSTTYFTKVNIF
jgi:hypothetical protein